MGWMIFIAKEKDIGNGCICCRFRLGNVCTADERVDIHEPGDPDEINEYRPYGCPFRHFDSAIRPIIDRFNGMTTEETAGYFKGADHEHRRYIRLEKERDRYVSANARERAIQAVIKGDEDDGDPRPD